MKNFKSIFMALGLLTFGNVYAGDHGGGNGGSDLEITLKKRSQQIAIFLKSSAAQEKFRNLNADAIMSTVDGAQIDIVSEELFDKFGTARACLNFPASQLIQCNAAKAVEMIKTSDIFTATLFHEILGLMEIELGHENDVSLYPISSKIIPYDQIVSSTIVSEKDIRPEYFGLDSRSYGIEIQNSKTKESIRMICLNDNIEIHRCVNFGLVRMANNMQAPLIPEVITLSRSDLKKINLRAIPKPDIQKLEKDLQELKGKGVDFLTLGGTPFVHQAYRGYEKRNIQYGYRYGMGATQLWFGEFCGVQKHYVYREGGPFFCTILPLTWPVHIILPVADTVVEIGKQGINIVVYPIKALEHGIRIGIIESQINKYNDQLSVATNVLNLRNELSLIGTKVKVSNEKFNMLTEILTQGLLDVKNIKINQIH